MKKVIQACWACLPTQKDTQQKTCFNHQDERELHSGKNQKHVSTGILHTHTPNPAFHLSYVGLSLTACVFHNLHSFCYKWNLIRCNKKEESPDGSVIKNPPAMRETWLDPWVGKIPWRRKWQPNTVFQVFLPGKSQRQRSLVGYSPGGHKESDKT